MPAAQIFKPPNPETWKNPENWSILQTVGNVALSGAEIPIETQAAHAFEGLLDPNHTLPDVFIRADERRSNLQSGPWQGYDIYSPEGQHIGYFNLVFDHTDNKAFFAEIMLGKSASDREIIRNNDREPIDDGDVRGKGYGLATYKKIIPEAIRQGYGFKSYPKRLGHGLSKDGYRMWLNLKKAGAARITELGEVNPDAKTFEYATTRFEILSPEDLIAATLQSSPED